MRYTKDEMADLLAEAAEGSERTYSLDEVREAAEAAGIDPEAIDSVRRRPSTGRGLRSGLAVVAVGAVLATGVMLLAPQASLQDESSLLLHNEARYQTYRLELLVPTSCEPAAPNRADDFCAYRTVRLEPGMRQKLRVPAKPCAQVWVRTYTTSDVPVHSALFELPAGVEIEKGGRLDQKGIGRPSMLAPPEPATRAVQPCRGAA